MIEKDLARETEKWLKKAAAKRKKVRLIDKSKSEMLKNIDAYVSDTKHFAKKGDMIRAFEAIVWAWAWMEILEELEIVKTSA
ncbi:MAG: hypothetical protein QT00_C0002G0391 [archaeon GW2011_AR5]|nr:MAG: hypothetical protein QT00_C0002G0391 [archaeon GW2011_AR5]